MTVLEEAEELMCRHLPPLMAASMAALLDGAGLLRQPERIKFQRGSTTSRRAALDNWPRRGSQRDRVLKALIRRPSTDDELTQLTGLLPNSVRPRRIELVEGGFVTELLDDEGQPVKRETRTGSKAQVWTATVDTRARMLEADHDR